MGFLYFFGLMAFVLLGTVCVIVGQYLRERSSGIQWLDEKHICWFLIRGLPLLAPLGIFVLSFRLVVSPFSENYELYRWILRGSTIACVLVGVLMISGETLLFGYKGGVPDDA